MWAIGVEDLCLPLDWLERLTLREFHALMDRHMLAVSREDFFHSRTRQGMAGGKLADIMVYKQILGASRKSMLLGPDGKPVGMDFSAVARLLEAKLPESE